jgi:hypothetical protein
MRLLSGLSPLSVPFDGGLALIRGEDGRFRLKRTLRTREFAASAYGQKVLTAAGCVLVMF